MHPLLMDAVITARQDELRRAARHAGDAGRRTSRIRALVRSASSHGTRPVPGEPSGH